MKEKIVSALAICGSVMIVYQLGALRGAHVTTERLLEVYEQGKKDALSTTPRPSLELEMRCASIWANQVPVPEALR